MRMRAAFARGPAPTRADTGLDLGVLGQVRAVATAIVLGLAALLAALPASTASAVEPAQLTLEDRLDLARVEQYMAGIRTMRARFAQAGANGGVARGDFYLRRPGRMRLAYDPPVPYLYVADGTWLTFWDPELEQRSDVRLGSTIVDFITREDVLLTNNPSITIVDLRRRTGELYVTVVQTDEPEAGSMTLVFKMDPVELDRWIVLDARGGMTEVALHGQEYGMTLGNDLFVAPRPGFHN